MTEEKPQEYKPIRWSEDNLVMFLDGYGWTSLVLDGRAEHVCLGKEDNVKKIFAGEKPVSEASSLQRERALIRIMEIREVQNARTTKTRGRRFERRRPLRYFRHRQQDARRPKKRTTIPSY